MVTFPGRLTSVGTWALTRAVPREKALHIRIKASVTATMHAGWKISRQFTNQQTVFFLRKRRTLFTTVNHIQTYCSYIQINSTIIIPSLFSPVLKNYRFFASTGDSACCWSLGTSNRWKGRREGGCVNFLLCEECAVSLRSLCLSFCTWQCFRLGIRGHSLQRLHLWSTK